MKRGVRASRLSMANLWTVRCCCLWLSTFLERAMILHLRMFAVICCFSLFHVIFRSTHDVSIYGIILAVLGKATKLKTMGLGMHGMLLSVGGPVYVFRVRVHDIYKCFYIRITL